MKSRLVLLSLLAVALLAALPGSASAIECSDDPGYRWTVRGFGAWIDAGGARVERTTMDPFQSTDYALQSGGDGVGAELEYRVNCPVGLTLGLLSGNIDTMVKYDDEFQWLMENDDLDINVLSLGANFHLSPRSRFDFFVGPFLAITDYGDLDSEDLPVTFESDLDGDVGFGVNAGFDVPFKPNGPWAFTAGVRYIASSADGDGFSLDVDPLIATAGIAYRWNGSKCGPCASEIEEPPPPPPAPEPEPEIQEAAPAPPPPPPPPPPPAPREERETCHFDTNGSRVSNICKAKLDEVALKLKQDPSIPTVVIGHADSTGNDRINDPLSVRRAEAVKQYLVERHSIDADRITTEGRGSREPVASNDTREGRAENRRAVVIITIG